MGPCGAPQKGEQLIEEARLDGGRGMRVRAGRGAQGHTQLYSTRPPSGLPPQNAGHRRPPLQTTLRHDAAQSAPRMPRPYTPWRDA